MSIKVSVVMASFLGDYEYSASDRIRKFHRAIDSFLNQTYQNKELIVVSDGCDLTIREIAKYYHHPNIKLSVSEKQPLFSGMIRNIGCFMATGDVICYLDTDDFIGVNHLFVIAYNFQNRDIDWAYFDDYIIYRFNPTNNEILSKAKRDVGLERGTIGTSSIAHKKNPQINWIGCDHYNHDWTFIKRLIDFNLKSAKIEGCEYFVCHIPTQVDN